MYIAPAQPTTPAQYPALGETLANTSAEIICPTIFVPNIIIGAPVQVAQLLSASCMNLPGAYILVEFSPSILEPHRIRIGEGGNVGSRLAGKRDEWLGGKYVAAVVVTCSHPRWDKTCAENLEARLTAIVEGSRTAEVERERAPKHRHLSHDVQRAMDGLIDIVRIELERRRLGLLTQTPLPVSPQAWWLGGAGSSQSVATGVLPEKRTSAVFAEPVRVLSLCYEDLCGELEERADHVMIRRGTEVSCQEVSVLQTASRIARRVLLESGVIVEHPTKRDRWIFAADHRVGSLTTASRIVTGSTQSGTRVWRQAKHRVS